MSAISTPVTPSSRRRLAPFIALGAVVVFAAAWFLVLHKHGSSSDSSSSSGSTPATTTPGAAPATGTSAPATATPAPSGHAATKPAGHAAASRAQLSDPFGRHLGRASTPSPSSTSSSPSPAAQPSAPVSATPAPATSTGGAPSASSPTTSTPVSSTGTLTAEPTTTSTTPTAVATHPWRVYRADVRVTPAKSSIHRRLARLTPLAVARLPFALYLGAVRGGKRVAFLLNRNATVAGRGRCAPFHRGYRVLYLKANQGVHVSIPFFGTTLTYRLGVMHLTSRPVSTAHAARVANHRVSEPGRAMMRRLGLLKWARFSTERGVVPAPKRLTACS